jgi:hypothetical protein
VTRGRLAVLALLAGCGGAGDPCADVAGACLTVQVSSSTVDEIDQLELDILYGDRHATASTQGDGGGVVGLPLATAIALDDATGALDVGVVAAGKLSGVVLGTGAGRATLAPGAHATISIRLAPIDDCVAGSFYCGGDRLAGDPDTLYQCNAGGVPLARGVCAHGCLIRPTEDDACSGGPETCSEGGFYCGGNEVDGDPQTRYTCTGGAGSNGIECADGCMVAPAGTDDDCR